MCRVGTLVVGYGWVGLSIRISAYRNHPRKKKHTGALQHQHNRLVQGFFGAEPVHEAREHEEGVVDAHGDAVGEMGCSAVRYVIFYPNRDQPPSAPSIHTLAAIVPRAHLRA